MTALLGHAVQQSPPGGTRMPEEAIMSIETMSCGGPRWECDLLGHDGHTVVRTEPRPGPRYVGGNPFLVREMPRPRISRVPRPGDPRPRNVEQRHQARDAKRIAEHIKSVQRAQEQRSAALRRKVADAQRRVAILASVDEGAPAVREVTVTPSQSVRNPARVLVGTTCRRLRVWQLAEACELTSAEVVTMLRESGEWVNNAQSTVVEPVAKRFYERQLVVQGVVEPSPEDQLRSALSA